MGKISVFNHVTIDGYFAGPNGEIDWFKDIKPDEEWYNYTHQQAGPNAKLFFGHTTYEMMKSFWPTQQAMDIDPEMANAVNNSHKIVFSKKLKNVKEEPRWKNVTLRNEIIPEEIKEMTARKDITILGSGSIIIQLTNMKLIDEFFLVVVPVILGNGKSFFSNIKENLKLVSARSFNNGIVLLHYQTQANKN